MGFLIKLALFIGLLVWFVPLEEKTTNQPASAEIASLRTLAAAGAALSDAKSFCERQPEACAVGASLFDRFGEKAATGAKMVYEYLDQNFGGHKTADVQPQPSKTGVSPSKQTNVASAQ